METILKFLTSPAGKGVLRHVLTVVGTLMVAKTWLSQSALDTFLAQSDTIFGTVGTLLTAVVTVWSVVSKKTPPPAPPTPPAE